MCGDDDLRRINYYFKLGFSAYSATVRCITLTSHIITEFKGCIIYKTLL